MPSLPASLTMLLAAGAGLSRRQAWCPPKSSSGSCLGLHQATLLHRTRAPGFQQRGELIRQRGQQSQQPQQAQQQQQGRRARTRTRDGGRSAGLCSLHAEQPPACPPGLAPSVQQLGRYSATRRPWRHHRHRCSRFWGCSFDAHAAAHGQLDAAGPPPKLAASDSGPGRGQAAQQRQRRAAAAGGRGGQRRRRLRCGGAPAAAAGLRSGRGFHAQLGRKRGDGQPKLLGWAPRPQQWAAAATLRVAGGGRQGRLLCLAAANGLQHWRTFTSRPWRSPCPPAVERDLRDADAVCRHLGIPLHEANFVSAYWNEVGTG